MREEADAARERCLKDWCCKGRADDVQLTKRMLVVFGGGVLLRGAAGVRQGGEQKGNASPSHHKAEESEAYAAADVDKP